LVYSASGYNKGKDRLKSSFHLVWPDLKVNSDGAKMIRAVTLQLFNEKSKHPSDEMFHTQQKFLQFFKSNEWESVFDKTTVSATNGLRLPYNDKASRVFCSAEEKRQVDAGELAKNKAKRKLQKEGRYSKAIGELLFKFEPDASQANQEYKLVEAKWIGGSKKYSIADWIQKGSCRLDMSDSDKARLTELAPTGEGKRLLQELKRTTPSDGNDWELDIDLDDDDGSVFAPLKKVRRCDLSTKKFVAIFDEHLGGEIDVLETEDPDLAARLNGSWITVSAQQATWRGSSRAQFRGKRPEEVWAKKTGMCRPVELVYLRKPGKIIVDGPNEPVEAICDILRRHCETIADDVRIVPRW